MIYGIGKTYKIADRQVEIINKFEDTASCLGSIHPATYYIVKLYPGEFITVILEDHLNLGDLKAYIPSIANKVASKGRINTNECKKQFDMWKDMIYRCYMPTAKIYPLYGQQGIKVHPKWMCFEYFMYDYNNIPNSELPLTDKSGITYVIDLDWKQLNLVPVNQRVYGPDAVEIKTFYGSDVMEAVNYMNNSSPALQQPKQRNYKFLSGDGSGNKPQVQKQEQKTPYTLEDYARVIEDHSFMDQYPRETSVEMINPILHGPIYPATESHEPGKHIMCVKVPEGTVRHL